MKPSEIFWSVLMILLISIFKYFYYQDLTEFEIYRVEFLLAFLVIVCMIINFVWDSDRPIIPLCFLSIPLLIMILISVIVFGTIIVIYFLIKEFNNWFNNLRIWKK